MLFRLLSQLARFFCVTRRCNLFGRATTAELEMGVENPEGEAARMRVEDGKKAGFSLFCGSYPSARHCPTPMVGPLLPRHVFFFFILLSSSLFLPHPLSPYAGFVGCVAPIQISKILDLLMDMSCIFRLLRRI